MTGVFPLALKLPSAHVIIWSGITMAFGSASLADTASAPGTTTPPQRMMSKRITYPPPIPAPAEIHLTAQFVEPKVSIGNIVLLQAVMENDSKDTLYMKEWGAGWFDFAISVKNASGNDVPITEWGKEQAQQATQMAHTYAITMNVDRPLSPGEKVTYQFVLNRQFDLSKDGVYHVVITQPGVYLSATQKTLPIVSNEADIELIEPTPDIENPQNLGH